MPHLIIEFTDNLDAETVLQCLAAANEVMASSGHFDEMDIKSRARAVSLYQIGTRNVGRAFVAATLSLLPGRSNDVKRDLANKILQSMSRCLPKSDALTVQISVEVVEIDKYTYAKAIL